MASSEKHDAAEFTPRRPSIADVERAAHQLLDLVERPVGTLRGFELKAGAETDRAIVALFDALERKP